MALTRAQQIQRLKQIDAMKQADQMAVPQDGDAAAMKDAVLGGLGKYASLLQLPQKYMSRGIGAMTAVPGANTPSDLTHGMGIVNPLLMPTPAAWRGKDPAQGVADTIMNGADDPMNLAAGYVNKLARGPEYAAGAFKLPIFGQVRPIGVANAALSPAEALSEMGATRGYKTAFSEADRMGMDNNKPILASQLMREAGYTGSPGSRDAAATLRGVGDEAGAKMGQIRDEATARGVTGNFHNQVAPHIDQEIAEMRGLKDPAYNDTASKMQNYLEQSRSLQHPSGDIPFNELGDTKSAISSRVAKAGGEFSGGYDNADQTMIQDAMGNGYRRAEDKAIADQAPDLAGPFQEAKDVYSSSRPELQDQMNTVAARVKNQKNPWMPSKVAAMAGATTLATGDPAGMAAALANMVMDVGRHGLTYGAYGADRLARAGQYGLLDSTLRQALNSQSSDGTTPNRNANPWSLGGGQ